MSALTANPELQRNGRIQLRRGRMLAAAVICAAVSLSFVAVRSSSERIPRQFFVMIFLLQAAALVIGGSIYCLQSVQREKDQNTFDFQRITRLSPLQLALGKIFGAPALMYFAGLCMMPVALWAAISDGVEVPTFFAMYFVLLLGAVTFHSLAVLLSMVLEKGTSAGAMFLFLWAIGITAIDGSSGYSQGPLAIHAIGPFWLYNLLGRDPNTYPPAIPPGTLSVTGPTTDLFFGYPVPHAFVLMVLYVSMTAWFLLALARNIKRDPSVYELFRPVQALGLALYLNFLVLAFFHWVTGFYRSPTPTREGFWQFDDVPAKDAATIFLLFSFMIFVFLGLTLLRSRERARRFLREFGSSSADWLAAIWPAPYLILGTILSGGAILLMIRAKNAPLSGWSFPLGFLQVGFVTTWLARDFIYLQWMNLRRVRRPLMSGVLFMVVFYACLGVVLSAFGLFGKASSWISAIFLPSGAFSIDAGTWSEQSSQWLVALALLGAQAMLFAWLQRRELKRLTSLKPAGAPETA